jgi:hypothetical protein
MFKELILIEPGIPTSVYVQKSVNASYREPDQSSFYVLQEFTWPRNSIRFYTY